jgi:hypothetical protein
VVFFFFFFFFAPKPCRNLLVSPTLRQSWNLQAELEYLVLVSTTISPAAVLFPFLFRFFFLFLIISCRTCFVVVAARDSRKKERSKERILFSDHHRACTFVSSSSRYTCVYEFCFSCSWSFGVFITCVSRRCMCSSLFRRKRYCYQLILRNGIVTHWGSRSVLFLYISHMICSGFVGSWI